MSHQILLGTQKWWVLNFLREMRKNRVGQNVLTVIIELRRFPLSAMELTNARERENGFNISFYFQGHWPFPRDKLMQGYAYILTHPRTVSP